MPGRNPEEAWRDFRDPIRRTVGAVDLTTRLIQRRFPEERRLLATPSTGIAFGKELTLIFSLLLEPVPFETTQWRMTTRRYDYTIVHDSGDLVFGWHWHPESKRSRVTYPHIHVPSAGRYRTRHIPTGRISLEDVVLFGIDDLGVAGTYPTAREVVSEVQGPAQDRPHLELESAVSIGAYSLHDTIIRRRSGSRWGRPPTEAAPWWR